MSQVSELIISVRDLYFSGVPNQAIADHLNISLEMVQNIIQAYCGDDD